MAQTSSSTIEASSSPSSAVHDGSTIENAIKKTIDGIQTLLNPVNNMTPEEEEMAEKMAVI
jgi:hypothetical protein